jgi:hypothetical protein
VKLGIFLVPYPQINSKQIKNLRHKTLRRKHGDDLYNAGLGRDFFDITPFKNIDSKKDKYIELLQN